MKIRNYMDYLDEDNDEEPMPRKTKSVKKSTKKPNHWQEEWGGPQKDSKKEKRAKRVIREEE